jgi:Transposase DDE domain
MTTVDFITELYCRIADRLMQADQEHKHSQAKLYASEVVTLAVLYSLKGSGQRAFFRWLTRDYRPLFPQLPERTRLFRWFNTHRALVEFFLAEPSLLGVIDSYGIELLHPRREGRSETQIGKKGKSNWRWIVGGKLCFVLNHLGLIVAWDCNTANVYDGSAFQHLVDDLQDEMLLFADTGFDKVDWQPTNLRLCQRGEWNVRMVVETVLSMLTYVCHFKHMAHKSWAYFRSHLAYTLALFNLLVEWHGLTPDDSGFVHLSIADFSL